MYVMNALFVLARKLWNFGVPESAPPQLRDGCRAMLAATLPLWALGCVGASLGWDWATTSLVHDAAVVTAVGAIVCWGQTQAYDHDRHVLTRALGDALQRLPEDDRREILMRAVSSR
jgi:hypothetical protein